MKIMLLGGGKESMPVIERALEMGLDVYAADQDENCPAAELLSGRFVPISTYDSVNLGSYCEANEIYCALPACTDTRSVADYIMGEEWPYDSKLEQKKLLGDLAPKRLKDSKIGVIKPVFGCGSRGVSIGTIEWCRNGQFVEEYIEGPQYSVEAFNHGGLSIYNERKWSIVAVVWRVYDCEIRVTSERRFKVPSTIERGGIWRHDYFDVVSNWIDRHEDIFNEFPIGPYKFDLVEVKPKEFKVIEFHGRLSGGQLSTKQIPMATGIDYVSYVLQWVTCEDFMGPEHLIPQFKRDLSVWWDVSGDEVDMTERGEQRIITGGLL